MTNGEIFTGFYGAAFGAIIGALLAFFFTRYSLQSEQRKKLEKIHKIISDEFYRIYVYATDARDFITRELGTEKEFKEHFWEVEYEITRGRGPVIFSLPNFRFLLWDAIESSGSLISLKSDEIQLINSTHNDMIIIFQKLETHIKNFHNKFSILDEKNNLKRKITKITENDLQMFLTYIYTDLVGIQRIFDKLSTNILWIKKEFSNENLRDDNEFYDIHLPTFISVPFPKSEESEKKTPV